MGGDRRQVDELQEKLAVINIKLEQTLAEQALILVKMQQLQSAFEQAQGAVKFVKFMAAAALFCLTLWGTVREIFR